MREGDCKRTALPDLDADVLRVLLAAERATTVIEVGLAYGASALAIASTLVASGATDARHVVIDAYRGHFHDVGWSALLAAGLAGVSSLRREQPQLALQRPAADGFADDNGFVDGSQIFHNGFADLCFLGEIICPSGIVIADDCRYPSVATAVPYFEINAGWQSRPIDADARLRTYGLPNRRVEPSFEDFHPLSCDDRPRETRRPGAS
jgi:predicted O-methyltransferase YrrM